MNTLIRYFCNRHLLVNLITIIVFVGGVVSWKITNKEELPDITFNTVRISTTYSGASAEDVEFYVTKPLEESLQGIDGVYRLTSTSSSGRSSIAVELDRTVKDIDKVVTEIQSQVSSVSLPEEVLTEPRVRVFETSKKAIIDIAIYDEAHSILDVNSRIRLQELARGLENKLLAAPEVFDVTRSGYLVEELNINVNPKKVVFYEIPLTDIAQEIQRNHVRAPSGTLKSGKNEQVTVLSELDSKEKLENVVVQGGFDSKPVKLKSIATITDGFENQTSIEKVNGRETVMFEVVKNTRYGILEVLDKVRAITEQYEQNVLSGTTIRVTFLDDESVDVRNRLSIVSSNGLLGFCLIVITLFIFLNKRSGFWVALGIPFTLCCTLIAGYFMGYTINGITLAGIIIVLGIVVDDAIIIAENISRRIHEGQPLHEAAIEGTIEVVPPIIASILTTCVAFIPLFFFSGRFGNFVKFIPPIIFLMLFASLFESFFLLPSHMTLFSRKGKVPAEKAWFKKWEDIYERFLTFLLPKRYLVLILFCVLMVGTVRLVQTEFKFVMFPEEESREIVVSGIATHAETAIETAKAVQPLEEFLKTYIGKEGIGVRSNIASGRRGDAAQENQFRITLETVPSEHRDKSSDELIKEIKTFAEGVDTLGNIRFRKNRFGQDSGSTFEIVVQENDDAKRESLVKKVVHVLQEHPSITNVEEDVIPSKREYIIQYNQEQLKKLSVNPSNISTSLRTILNGRQLYTLFRNDEEIEVTLTVNDDYRTDMNRVLSVPIANSHGYLIPLKELVTVKEVKAKHSIRRQRMKRSSFVYADLKKGVGQSPLDVADEFERTIFPKILAEYPSSQLHFEGEVIDTRESKRDLMVSIIAVIALIYIVLAILFDSIVKPLRIMLVIPFGIIGVVLAFYMHGKILFGFYAAIGTLGMLGVVVNDAIVMLTKLDSTDQVDVDDVSFTADVAKTRLRAILLTTLTTVAGVMPTAYGVGGTDTMLSDMMLSLAWGLLFGTMVTLVLTPCFYLFERDIRRLSRSMLKPLLSIAFLFLCSYGFSTPIDAADKEITLSEFITLATQNDLRFHAILMDNLSLVYNQDRYVTAPERLVSFVSGLNVDLNNIDSNSSLSLTQTLPDLGRTYSTKVSFDALGSDDNSLTFGFSQDIARNAMGKSIQLDHQIQSIKTELSRYQIIEAYEDYMAQLITLYYVWIRQYESFRMATASYAENEKVLKSILERQKKKIANETDVNKLRLQILAKKEQLIRYEKSYIQTSQQIQRSTKIPLSDTIYPDSTVVLDELPLEMDTFFERFKGESRSFTMLSLLNEQYDTAVSRSARDLMPSIVLSGTLTQSTDTSATLGATLGFPLQNKAAKATYEVAKINKEKSIISTGSAANILITSIDNLYVALKTQEKLVKTAQEKKKIAAAILKDESENYSYGRISLNDYITAVNRYDTSRFDEIDQKVTFQELSVEWKRLTDQLVSNTIE